MLRSGNPLDELQRTETSLLQAAYQDACAEFGIKHDGVGDEYADRIRHELARAILDAAGSRDLTCSQLKKHAVQIVRHAR